MISTGCPWMKMFNRKLVSIHVRQNHMCLYGKKMDMDGIEVSFHRHNIYHLMRQKYVAKLRSKYFWETFSAVHEFKWQGS